MAVSLVGEIVNSCDNTTGFNTGNISGDDDFVEGTGAIGVKASATTQAMYTTSLGASAPYDFSSSGSESGDHIIMWFNSKSPIDATAGFRIIVGDGTNQGHWNVVPSGFYKGGFTTRVIDTAADFNSIPTGSWTTTGNPAQLTGITEVGGVIQTSASVMGSFNNFQLDQMTIGTGVRVDAGTVGTPNTFETVRSADEDTNFWGWWSSSQGAIVGKGKMFIGPASGSATSVFNDSGFTVIFADEIVATGFYEIKARGAGTDVTWDLANINAANAANARWNLTIDSTTNSFDDLNGVWTSADQISLSAASTLTGTSLIDCNKLIQNSAILDSITIISANTADGVAFIESDDPANISDSSFEFSDGHAIEITATGTYSFSGNTFNNYGADDTNDAAIYNNSGGSVTLNITGGGNTPTVRNGSGASTTVNISVDLEINGLTEGSRGVMIGDGGAEDGNELLAGYADSSGKITGSFSGSTPQDVVIKARNSGIINAAIMHDDGTGDTDFTNDARDLTGANDIDLLPASPALNDAFYFGGIAVFEELLIKVTTAGDTYTLVWEYWDGGTWSSLSVTDNTDSFQTSGWNTIDFSKPNDWATTTVASLGPYFYVRARVTSGGGSQPKAESITLNKTTKYLPFNSTGTIQSGSGLVTTAVWIKDSNNL